MTPSLLTVTPSLLLLQEAADSAAVGFSVAQIIQRDPASLIRAALLLAVGMPVAWGVSRWIRGYFTRVANPQRGLIVGRLVYYTAAAVIFVTVLSELGFSLAPLLGAAGILGIALGFASQTSVSNIISGFFLLAEEPFAVGDLIKVGDITGQVLTIDTLSVKIRTFDNKQVRIPNETLVKSQVTTITRWPIRRVDINVGVAYKEDIGRVREVLLELADANPNVLMEPEPLVIFQGYGDSSINFLFAVWAKKENFLLVRNGITEEIKLRFDEEGIENPFPHRTLYTGSVTDAFPVRIVGEGAQGSGDQEGDDPREGREEEPGGGARTGDVNARTGEVNARAEEERDR